MYSHDIPYVLTLAYEKKSISYTWTARKNTLLLLPPWGTLWKNLWGKSEWIRKNSNLRIWKLKNQPRKWWPSIVPAEFLPLSLPFFSPGQFPTSDWWLHYAKIDWAAMGHLMFFCERTSHKMRERWWTWCNYPSSRLCPSSHSFLFSPVCSFPQSHMSPSCDWQSRVQRQQHWSYHATCVHLHRPCISHPDSFFAFSDCSFFSFFGFLSPPRQSPCNTQLQTFLSTLSYLCFQCFITGTFRVHIEILMHFSRNTQPLGQWFRPRYWEKTLRPPKTSS